MNKDIPEIVYLYQISASEKDIKDRTGDKEKDRLLNIIDQLSDTWEGDEDGNKNTGET